MGNWVLFWKLKGLHSCCRAEVVTWLKTSTDVKPTEWFCNNVWTQGGALQKSGISLI